MIGSVYAFSFALAACRNAHFDHFLLFFCFILLLYCFPHLLLTALSILLCRFRSYFLNFSPLGDLGLMGRFPIPRFPRVPWIGGDA